MATQSLSSSKPLAMDERTSVFYLPKLTTDRETDKLTIRPTIVNFHNSDIYEFKTDTKKDKKLISPTVKFNLDILTTDRETETVTKPNLESDTDALTSSRQTDKQTTSNYIDPDILTTDAGRLDKSFLEKERHITLTTEKNDIDCEEIRFNSLSGIVLKNNITKLCNIFT